MSDINEFSEIAEDDAKQSSKGLDVLQLLFWLSVTVAAGCAGVALTWQDRSGPAAMALILAFGSLGLVLLLWVLRGAGRHLGLFPSRGAAEEAAQKTVRGFVWLDALEEPSLVTERGGACVKANQSYQALTAEALETGDTTPSLMSVDRLFGANPGMAAPIYRLSKAVKSGAPRVEVLPAVMLSNSPAPVQFEASVSMLGKTRALWRLRRVDASVRPNSAVDPRALYVEDAPVGFFSARRDGRVVYVNSNLRKILGLPDELDGLRLEDLLRPEGLKLMKRETRGGASQRADVVLRARSGVELPALLTTTWTGKGPEALSRSVVHLAYDQEKIQPTPGPVDGTTGNPVAFDDTMFFDAPFGVARLDGEGVENAVMLDVNRSLRDMTEASAQPGARFADLFLDEEGGDTLAESLAKALDGAVELKLSGEDARTVDVFIALDRRGRPAAAYVIDTTEKKQLELRLAQGEKLQAMGHLAGGIAHDFNNLLQGIMLNTDRLIMRHPPGDPSFFELRSINELSARAAELVRMLLAWSRKQTFKRAVLDMSEVLSNYHILLRQIIDERIKLDMVHGRDLPYIRADKGQLEAALTNLCTNARDAMIDKSGGGELTIRTSRAEAAAAVKDGFNLVEEGEYLLIEVIDDGGGIPAEIIDEIFQPYVTTKEQGKGTGLGLATVYGIVKQSGGYIYPVSKIGRGTTFKIFLPAYYPKEEELHDKDAIVSTSPGTAPEPLSGRGRIMLVEDEEGVRGIAAQLLSSFGYQVLEAEDGEDALELIKEHSGAIDLLISDVVLPGMDGPALLKEAKPYLAGARVMFISGYAERDLAKTLDEDAEISFLPKPFTLRQLAERVKQELHAGKEAA